MDEVKELRFPRFLPFKSRTYAIRGYIGEVTEYVDNKGYVDKETDKVYICSKEHPPAHSDVPILFIREDHSQEKRDSTNSKTDETFVLANTYELSYDKIEETTSGDEILYNEEALADMNAASAVFVPIINEEDDSLKKVIKQVIIEKGIDINRLKHRMPQKYGLSNMKSALIGKTRMSISNFNVWCELLGVSYDIIISDNGTDRINPLQDDIYFTSDTNKIVIIPKLKEAVIKVVNAFNKMMEKVIGKEDNDED